MLHPSPRRAVTTSSPEIGELPGAERLPRLIQGLFASPPEGMVALIRGPEIVLSLATFAAGLYALRGHKVLLVDASNSTDPYIVSRLALAARQDPQQILSRIHIIRTFTVHQLAALAFRRLNRLFGNMFRGW